MNTCTTYENMDNFHAARDDLFNREIKADGIKEMTSSGSLDEMSHSYLLLVDGKWQPRQIRYEFKDR